MTVSWGGKDYDLKDVITDPTYKGKAYDGSYEIGFSGNLENPAQRKDPDASPALADATWESLPDSTHR